MQCTKLSERSIRLRWWIEAWQEFQHLYMPGVAMLRACSNHEAGGTPIIVTTMELTLPSQSIHHVHCDARLIKDEWKLRIACASDLLHELQCFLLIRRHLYRSKLQYGTGQRHHTRSVVLIKNVQEKVDRAVGRYRAMRRQLVILAGHLNQVGWDDKFQLLQDEDIRAPDEEDPSNVSEGRRTLTWIWRSGSVSRSDSAAQEGMRHILFL